MKTRTLLSVLLFVVLLTSLVMPAMAQGPAQDTAQPQPLSLEEQWKLGLIGDKEYDALAPVESCGPDAAWPGPDGFGYAGQTVDFNWVDITATGTLVTGWSSKDDGYAGPFPIGFDFGFYGNTWSSFYTGSNGFLSFGAGSTSLSNQCPLPSSTTPDNIIPLLWDDLNLNTSGDAYYQTFDPCPVGTGMCTVVEYYNIAHYGGAAGSAGTWEAILFADGNILIQLLDPGVEFGSSSTTGIEGNNYAGDFGLTYACNVSSSLTPNLAIQFVPPPPAPDFGGSTKAAPGKVLFGEPIGYTITILNNGDAPGLETTMVDPIPAGTVYNGDVACSSGTCSFDGANVVWAGQVATPPKGEWKPPAAAGGKQAKGPDGPANPTGQRSVFPKVDGTVLLDQQPNQSNGIFADASCDLCGGAQVIAENFALEDTATLEQVVFWTGYYPNDTPIDPDAIRVLIHQDAAGLPGTVVYDESNVAYTRAQTGVILFGVHEWLHTLTLGTPAVLPAGSYWIEIYNDTGWGTDDMFWEAGNADTIGRGLLDSAFAFEAPGSTWYYPNGYEMAFQLIGTIGEQPPENPVTVTFSVTPENPECGLVVVNEATISDPAALGDVVVQATTEVWEMVLLHEDFEGDVFPPAGWVEAHDPAGMAWTDQDLEPRGNLTGGTGKFAIVDDDYGGSAALTTAQLWTPPFDIPAGGYATQLLFKTDYNNISTSEQADVDISLDGGGTWTNLLHWNTDHRGPLTQSVDLTPFAGATGAILRFYYYDGAAYAWWWEIDDVQVVACYVAEPDIAVDPTSLEQTLCPDDTFVQELHICNWGDLALDWTLEEAVPPKGVQTVLWDNGPLVTHPAGGYNGEDASVLQTNLLLNTYGFGNQYSYGYRMADDFEVTDPAGWDVQQITFFAYQTGTYGYPPVSTITGLYFQIWNGSPDDPGSSVVFGDLVTNRLASTGWADMYRVVDYDMLNTQRPPMANVGTAGVVLPPGTYWLDWMTNGSGASGPWAPPISIVGEITTGNALQYTTAWAPALDTGTSTQQGMPFIVEGEVAGPPADLPWLSEDPLAGTVEPGTCQTVNVTFDSTGLAAGTYTGSLNVWSNDPDTPVVVVPVTLTVEECGVNTLTCGVITSAFRLDPYGREQIKWLVEAIDQNLVAVPLVAVDADLTWPLGGPVSRTRLTHGDGFARFHWGSVVPGTWTIDVTNMTLAGYVFADGPQCSATAVGK